ncbi:MAG: preprotein translocase subunit SecE [Actinobacteria bacterium]|nr:preprotein translocase subunit SecE [Actinomycetota bacterium]
MVNRETKRLLQRQGQLETDGSVAVRKPIPPKQRPVQKRTSIGQYLREVRGELRQVGWPSRSEVVNYSTVVVVTLILIVFLIFVLDYAFAHGMLFLFRT